MEIWTTEEYKRFSEAIIDKPMSYYAFEMLYWTGMRLEECLALTKADFDFNKNTVRINKSYQRLEGKDLLTTPKTTKSNRTIKLPKFLAEEMQVYFEMLYGYADIDEFLEETELLYKGMVEWVTKNKAEEALGEVKRRGVPFDEWSVWKKAEILQFQLDNNSYNIKLYHEVCKVCGVDISDDDKMFEDYQAIYNKTVDMQSEQRYERDEVRDRIR